MILSKLLDTPSPIHARYKNRVPDPGVCRITVIDWSAKRISMTNGYCSYYPSFDEIEIVSIEISHNKSVNEALNAITELEALHKWIKDGVGYMIDDAADDIARAILNRIAQIKALQCQSRS